MHALQKFWADEEGATTVDWVVLTAAVIGLSLSVIALITAGALDNSDGLEAHLKSITLATY